MKPARIIVLIIALIAGGLAALLAGRSDKPAPAPQAEAPKVETVDVLVARTEIAIGQTVTAKEMEWQAWPATTANATFIRRSERADAIEQLSGSIARVGMLAGEPIREQRLIKANGSGFMAAILPAKMRAISTEISPETGAGGFILPNDRVDVILTQVKKRPNAPEMHSSNTILRNVRVLAIDQTIEEKNGQRVVVGRTATLELSQSQAEALALARQLGKLSLALRSIADASRPVEVKPEEDQGTEVNIVRYGLPGASVK